MTIAKSKAMTKAKAKAMAKSKSKAKAPVCIAEGAPAGGLGDEELCHC